MWFYMGNDRSPGPVNQISLCIGELQEVNP
jgi:hypothetical protein